MSYEKLNLSNGATLKAEHLEHIESGIVAVEGKRYSKYTCLGDSISYGANSTTGNTSWCNYLAEMIGATLTKLASNGQRIWDVNHFRYQVERVAEDAELVTVMIGVNDRPLIVSGDETLGVVDDVIMMDNDEPVDYANSTLFNDSVLGRYRWCLERLRVKAPKARIVVFTPTPYNDSEKLVDIIRGEASICRALGLEVHNPTDSTDFNTTYFHTLQADTLHPNDAGYKVFAGYAYQKL